MQYWDGIEWTPRMKSIADLPQTQAPPSPYYSAGHSTMEVAPPDFRRDRAGKMQGLSAAVFMIVFGLIFIGIGSLPLGLAVRDAFSDDPTIEGTVVDVSYHESRSSTGSRSTSVTCAPISRFTLDGKEYTVSSNVYSGPCKWNVGQPIELIYDPAHPQNARAKSTGFNVAAAIFPVIGAVVAGLGVRNGLRELKSRRQARERASTGNW